MKVNWYAHLPGVELAEDGGIPLGMGQLVNLPFADWTQLDPTFPYAETDYATARPAFYVGEVDLPEDEGMGEERILGCVRHLHRAFLLHPDAPLLPSPLMSVIYLQAISSNLPGAVVWQRKIGPIEREWIMYGCEIVYQIGEQQLSRVRWAYDALQGFEPARAFPGVDAGLHILELTTRPEFWSAQRSLKKINEFVHCIAALEHILLPARKDASAEMLLAAAFGEYAAVLTTPSRDQLDGNSKMFSDLYRLRSRLLHGELGVSDLTEENWQELEVGRRLLADVIRQALVLGRTRTEEESLSQLLAGARKNADAHRSLLQRQGRAANT